MKVILMTASETKFREWIKKQCPGACIKKIPDFKQLGSLAVAGLPDYVVFYNGSTQWWEVKYGFGDTLNLNHFTPAQLVVFNEMLKNGVDVPVFAITKTEGSQVIYFSEIKAKRFIKFRS